MNRLLRSKALLIILSLSAVSALLLAYAIVVEPNWIRVETVQITLADLPEAFDGYRIALLSDFHCGGTWPGTLFRVKRAVQIANVRSPDLVLLAGDFTYHGAQGLRECFSHIGCLESRDGILAVLGNHDHWDDAEAVRSQLKGAGIPELNDSNFRIFKNGSHIWIAGIDDLWTTEPSVKNAVDGIPPEDVTILLSHNPDIAEHRQTASVDIILSGHTHGGQVWLPLVGAPNVPSRHGEKYRSGLVHNANTQIYVTRGIGLINPPVRFLCPPEVTIVTLRTPHPCK